MNYGQLVEEFPQEELATGARKEACPPEKGAYHLIPPEALHRLAVHYARGAKKYSERNWEMGIPFSRIMNSLLRHAFAFLRGAMDEDHLAAVAWNVFALMTYQERGRTELNDLNP